MQYEDFLKYFTIKRRINAHSVQALCPAHNDKEASLTISYCPGEEKILLHCHAGCSTVDILSAVGLTMKDLFSDDQKPYAAKFEAIYPYYDEQGKYMYSKMRAPGKKLFYAFEHGRSYDTKNITRERSLYNLPALLKHMEERPDDPIVFCEGEKDCDTLKKYGYTAVTSGSTTTWRKSFTKYFKDASIIFMPDNDDPGRQFINKVVRDVGNVCKKYKIVPTSAQEHGDVTDYLLEGHDFHDLSDLIDAEEWQTVSSEIVSSSACIGSNIELEMVRTNKVDACGQVIYKAKNCINNMVTVLRQDQRLAGRIRYDELARSPKYFGQLQWRKPGDTFGNWTDSDDAHVRAILESTYELKGKQNYEDAFNIVMTENSFNSIRDYLEALPEWDGTARIDMLLTDYLGAEHNDLNAAVMRLTMMGALARIYKPGIKFDYVLTLVGPQGIGKSKFLSMLAINQEWFDGNFSCLLNSKEAVERLRGKWILELAELVSMKRQKDSETIKAFISNSSDSYRESYGRRSQDYKRFCIFTASTNDYNFLTDRTGNRRFLPVECGKIKPTKSLFSNDTRDVFNAAWSEALYYFKQDDNNPALILSEEMQKAALEQQNRFLEEDTYVGLIQYYLDNPLKDITCVLDLWQNALEETGKPKRADSNRIHAIMRNEIEGWHEAGRQRIGEYGQQRCYERNKQIEIDDKLPF